jgi:hypothetical protein
VVVQDPAFVTTVTGQWVTTAQGAQARVTPPASPVSGPFAVMVEAQGGTADSHFFLEALWDGVPCFDAALFLAHDTDPTKSSGTVTIDPSRPDLGPGPHTLALCLRRQFPPSGKR